MMNCNDGSVNSNNYNGMDRINPNLFDGSSDDERNVPSEKGKLSSDLM